jgi:hypothetical protein
MASVLPNHESSCIEPLDGDRDDLSGGSAGRHTVMEDSRVVTGNHDGRGRVARAAPTTDSRARIIEKGSVALALLLEAHEYAGELDRDAWEFAVEIDCLHKAGLTNSDIRWLVGKQLAEHAHEMTTVEDASRRFRRIVSLKLTSSSCFVLTAAGVSFAQTVCRSTAISAATASVSASEQSLPVESRPDRSPPNHVPNVPKWDPDRRELRLGHQVVKQFRAPAMNQQTILAAFEEENWPPRIDDPLPPDPELEPKRRLHATINSLNGRQKNALIRFVGDGTGEGIRWELATPTADTGSCPAIDGVDQPDSGQPPAA